MTRGLIIAPAWIGDAILAQPLFMRLHEQIPQLELDVLTPPWTLPVFRRMPEIHQVIENPFGHGALQLLARRQLGKQLSGYQQAWVLPNSFKSALIPWFAGIPHITGYRGEMRGWLIHDCRDLDKTALPLMVERFAWLAQPANSPLQRPLPNPSLQIDPTRRAATQQRFGLNMDRPIIALCPGAEYGPAKRWPEKHFATLANQRLERGEQIWLFGGPADRPLCETINQATQNRCINLAGQTSLDESIDLLSLARKAITNDSGLMHIACALGVPVIALYGSSSPGFTPPLSPTATVISLNLACSPCFKRQCPLGHFDCLNKLEPSQLNPYLET